MLRTFRALFLLSFSFEVSRQGWTALMVAASLDLIGCTGALLDAGAEIEAKDGGSTGRTALHHAIAFDAERTTHSLLCRGAELETSVLDAAYRGGTNIVAPLKALRAILRSDAQSLSQEWLAKATICTQASRLTRALLRRATGGAWSKELYRISTADDRCGLMAVLLVFQRLAASGRFAAVAPVAGLVMRFTKRGWFLYDGDTCVGHVRRQMTRPLDLHRYEIASQAARFDKQQHELDDVRAQLDELRGLFFAAVGKK